MSRLTYVSAASAIALSTLAFLTNNAIAATRQQQQEPVKNEICQNGGCGSCTTDFGFTGRLINGKCYACQ